MLKATFTYSTVTPESAEQGDFEDHGFWFEGWRYPLTEQTDKDDFTQEYSLRDFIKECRDLGINDSQGCDWLHSDYSIEDYATMEEVQYCAHIEGVTEPTKNRIKRLVCGK